MINPKLTFITVLFIAFLSCIGIALPYPILTPLFIDSPANEFNHYLNFSPEFLLGFALATYPLGILIGSSFIGSLSDHFGRKKMMLWTLIFSVFGYFLSYIAIKEQFYLLFIFARFATGICEGNISIARAITLDLKGIGDKTRVMSILNAAIFAGWFFGPLLGGVLAEYGSELAFLVASVAIAFAAVMAIFFLQETSTVSHERLSLRQIYEQNAFHLIKQPDIRQAFFIQFFFTFGLNAFYKYYPAWLVLDYDFVAFDISQINATMTLAMTLTSIFIVSRYQQWLGDHWGMLISIAILGFSFITLMQLTDLKIIIMIFILIGTQIAIFNGIFQRYVGERHSEAGTGAVMGLLMSTFCLASTLIALLGAYLLTFSSTAPIIVSALSQIIALFLLYSYCRSAPQQTIKDPATVDI